MSETENEFFFQDKRSSLDSLKTLLDSFKILFRNPRIFISIFTILLLPLSLLLFALSLSSYSLKSEIYHLEALALASPTRFEARHLWKESRVDSLTLLRLKALFFVPSYVLSLFATITAVNSTALAYAGKRPNWETTVTAVRDTWKRPLVTSIFVYVIMLAYVHVPLTFSAFVRTPHVRLFVAVLGVVLEVYLMAVLSLGMVVSVMEERFGWEAVRIGWGLMERRRFFGWVLSGFLVLVSGGIGLWFRVLMEGQDFVVVATGRVGFIFLFGLVVLWSCVVTTVFYCDHRRQK